MLGTTACVSITSAQDEDEQGQLFQYKSVLDQIEHNKQTHNKLE
jgi:hypothetical protein